ncbi:hypothetical protein M0813_09482 [Anaeramoeba flamelloides]|uniref:Uncharacterized protein n=1 Tax=Anaeramoeba flamelloides TaxID=1746091 RepID=A0ABQ8X721_9EUKA|nr:hypothetical protein M0813_09482 [Anaeramoeba flamelloides]
MKTDFHELKELLKQISLQITCNNLGLPSKIESNQLVSIDQKNEAKQMKKLFKKNGGYHKTKTRNNKQEQLLFEDAIIALYKHYFYSHLLNSNEDYKLDLDDFKIKDKIFLDHVQKLNGYLLNSINNYSYKNPIIKIKQRIRHIRSLSWPTYRDFKQEIKKSQMGIEDKNAIKLQNNTNDDIRYKYLNALLQHEENDNILFFLNKFQLDHEENENKIKKNRKKAIFKNDVHHVRKRKRCLKKSSNNKQYQLTFPPKKNK